MCRLIFVYGGAIFALPGAFSLVTAVRFLNGRKFLFIDCGDSKRTCPALPILRDVITSISFRNGHKAPPKSLGHLRLRELRRQPLQKFAQKTPQPTALKPPSTARTAGRSDWAERRFRRQPFILLSFSSSKKLRKSQETQSYQRFQCIDHTAFNTSGTNASHLLPLTKVGTHSPSPTGSHTRAYTPKQGPSGRGRYHYPRSVPHVHKHPRAGCQNGVLCRFGILAGRCSRRTQKAFGTAMRLCVSLSRGVAAPPGCVIFLQFGDVAVFSLCAQYFLNVRGGGGITTLGVLCVLSKRRTAACQSDSFVVF